MEFAFFGFALAAAAALAALLAAALVRADFAFWPPPRPRCWQDYASWGLFRVYCGAVALCAIADYGALGWDHWSRFALGLPVMAGGFGAMVWFYYFLGIDNTYGESAGLVTRGVYALSRNPQYVASVTGAAGTAVVADSLLTLILAAVLLGLYTLMTLNEERWLLARYGDAYADYARRTPRFVDARSLARARAEILAWL